MIFLSIFFVNIGGSFYWIFIGNGGDETKRTSPADSGRNSGLGGPLEQPLALDSTVLPLNHHFTP